MKIVLEGGNVKGKEFVDGIFLKLNKYGQLVLVDAGRLYEEDTTVFIKSLEHQKFREVTILTMKELSD